MFPLLSLTPLATLVRDCTADGSPLTCKLASILRGLEVVAAMLGALLILVVAVAMLVYRRKKRSRSEIL